MPSAAYARMMDVEENKELLDKRESIDWERGHPEGHQKKVFTRFHAYQKVTWVFEKICHGMTSVSLICQHHVLY